MQLHFVISTLSGDEVAVVNKNVTRVKAESFIADGTAVLIFVTELDNVFIATELFVSFACCDQGA